VSFDEEYEVFRILAFIIVDQERTVYVVNADKRPEAAALQFY
jgi:hypothetical protein